MKVGKGPFFKLWWLFSHSEPGEPGNQDISIAQVSEEKIGQELVNPINI